MKLVLTRAHSDLPCYALLTAYSEPRQRTRNSCADTTPAEGRTQAYQSDYADNEHPSHAGVGTLERQPAIRVHGGHPTTRGTGESRVSLDSGLPRSAQETCSSLRARPSIRLDARVSVHRLERRQPVVKVADAGDRNARETNVVRSRSSLLLHESATASAGVDSADGTAPRRRRTWEAEARISRLLGRAAATDPRRPRAAQQAKKSSASQGPQQVRRPRQASMRGSTRCQPDPTSFAPKRTNPRRDDLAARPRLR